MFLSKNVIRLDCSKGSFMYAVTEKDGVTLIDTSIPGRGKKIFSELAGHGITPDRIKRILLTHSDADHIGNLPFILKKTGAKAYISRDELPCLYLKNFPRKIKDIINIPFRLRVAKTVTEFNPGEIKTIKLIEMPGHTRGHAVYEFGDILFSGDMFRKMRYWHEKGPLLVTGDRKQALESLKKIDISKYGLVCPAHGLPEDVTKHYDAFLKRLEKKVSKSS